MKILVISKDFYPDTVSVAQHLSDLCFALSKRGHQVKVISGRYPNDEKGVRYSSREKINEVSVKRIWSTGFGKRNIVSRLADFITFNISVFISLSRIKRKSFDLIIGLTAPPLLSYFGSRMAKKKSIKFCYWIMDMQPELAIMTGLIKKDSLTARVLISMGNSILNRSDKIIVLDRYMKEYIVKKACIDERAINIIPVWPVVDNIYEGTRLENPFRKENGFSERIVIMYSGNHSFVHPLETLLELASELKSDERFLFVFIGGGIRKNDVTEYKNTHKLNNIIQLPFQPREKIHYSLGSSDLQVVIMGNNLVGFTHPNKIYGAMFLGKPVMYIGPAPSHVTDILSKIEGNIVVEHGNVEVLKDRLLKLCQDNSLIESVGKQNREMASRFFSPDRLINEMCNAIEIFSKSDK